MADQLHQLLMYIVEHPVMQNESREAQLDATAVQDVGSEIAAISKDQRQRAEDLAPFFAKGLRLAMTGPLVVDDTTAEGNSIAEAFARYMVATNLANSQGTPVDNEHFRYTFEVYWQRLHQVAQRAGINLDAVLNGGQGSGTPQQ